LAAVLVACLSGCIHSVRVYEGDRRPRDEVAILTDSGCSDVVLVVIDEHNRVDSEEVPHRWSSYTAEILPGRHWATVKWVSSWREDSRTAAGVAILAAEITFSFLGALSSGYTGSTVTGAGKNWVPASIGSLSFSLDAEAGHKYRIRECEGPDLHASKAVQRCWQYIGLVTIQQRDSFHVWLVDETALREVGSD